MTCPLCGDSIDSNELQGFGTLTVDGERRAYHRECGVRSALGGIGHLEDHAYWCIEMNDPDGGRTYHQSALEVMAWIKEKGMPS
jgi:hypothetical protein